MVGSSAPVAEPTHRRHHIMKTFFYEKANGEIFAVEERGAYIGELAFKHKRIGVSDGATYRKMMDRALMDYEDLVAEIESREDELLDEKDPERKQLLSQKIKQLKNKKKTFLSKAHHKAFQAELEVAKTQNERPTNTTNVDNLISDKDVHD